VTLAALPAELEDTVRREALKRYLEGAEEQALDLLAVARAIATVDLRRTNRADATGDLKPRRQAVSAESHKVASTSRENPT
jgi:hypothetical protein